MAPGQFELRKDPITGWWVAVVVDREFERARFRRRAERLLERDGYCANCVEPAGGGVRLRMLKPLAFTVAGTEQEARQEARDGERDGERDGRRADRDGRQAGLGLVGERGSWQTIVAPARHHGPLAAEDPSIVAKMLTRARDVIRDARAADATEYVQVVQNWGRQAGAMTNHLCLDVYDVPQIPHRVGEELGGAARYLIREGVCPFCRLVRDEVAHGERLIHQDASGVAFAPFASRSPFEIWVVPRQHDADFGRATDRQLEDATELLRSVLGLLDVLDGPAYNLVLHTAPLQQRVDDTYHWHWEIHPRLREVGGLELGTGLPVNPVCPEEAVAELLAARRELTGAAPARAGRPVFGEP
jgi:UDPglucose--hexose-1-phosphate uridylyltransferase